MKRKIEGKLYDVRPSMRIGYHRFCVDYPYSQAEISETLYRYSKDSYLLLRREYNFSSDKNEHIWYVLSPEQAQAWRSKEGAVCSHPKM